MILRDQLIAIGRYNKPHGVAGEISASIDVDVEVLKALSCLISDVDGIFVPFFVTNCRPKTAETVLLTIDGFDNENEAAKLVNKDIFALKDEYRRESEIADAEGYPLDYFIGFNVTDEDGQIIGEIVAVDEQTENAIFIINRDDAEILIPAADDFIVEFDTDEKIMVMDLPQGLIDLD